MKKVNFPKLPKKIAVLVKKGVSGCLLAELPELDIFTEADGLNHFKNLGYTKDEVLTCLVKK
ncbi:MAG: hypothetical protein ABIJ03_01150 [Patescibacteria group bacterium]